MGSVLRIELEVGRQLRRWRRLTVKSVVRYIYEWQPEDTYEDTLWVKDSFIYPM